MGLADGGAQAPAGALRGVTSGDGRYVAFLSGDQLTTTPTNGRRQLYVRDRVTGRTVIASARGGQGADQDVAAGDAFNPFHDISGNGRYVVFVSTATNLVAADANGALADVFRADLVTGNVEVVSLNANGQPGNQSVGGDPSISYDGSRVAFTTGTATNIVPGDAGNASDVVVRDIAAGTTTLVSRNSAGQQAEDFAERPAISADGRVVAFEAGPLTTNLFPGDNNAVNDVLVHRLDGGTTLPAAVAANGQILGGGIPDLSGDGRYVVFSTGERLDPATDANNAADVYRRDMVATQTVLVSARDGLAANSAQGGSQAATSADGARVAFVSADVDLVTGDANNQADVFSRVVASNRTERASERADRSETASAAETPGVAGNGGLVTFTSPGAFAADDSNNADDVHAKETAPTDTIAPGLEVAVNFSPGGATVSGTVTPDPSGVGALLVDDAAVRPGADGTFSTLVPVTSLPGGTVRASATVVAVDGAGNRRELTRTLTVVSDPVGRAPAVSAVRRRVAGGRLTVRFRVSKAARVRLRIQRPVRVRGKLRFVWVGRSTVRTVRAGTRTLRITLPRRPGTYRMWLGATSDGATRVVTAVVRVRRG